ncbi:hypothetical protein [Actinokineospora spheciospongiae]|uniref:hypothetical protein n=1 Tax=Actinokineospora spheciospongiae TaxID=909613 RepID=UPI000DA0D3A7|nr:hypothetical protein [Actinokineospora spheciospongiae]PWW56209.1 hypothetical protein DFQ13_111144 [Actinokineospora spheciospongiae]
MAAWNELTATVGAAECAALVDVADRLRWSAPELAVQFAARALAGSADAATRTRAQALLGTAFVHLGRPAEAVEPGLAALRALTGGGLVERAAAVRTALAAAARALGDPLVGAELLRPVLAATSVRQATRALALGELVACTTHVGGRDDLEDVLAEADRLLAADDGLSQDGRRLDRALLAAEAAAYHRRHGDTEAAAESARDGLSLLNRMVDKQIEGGRARARLTLELVCALLDDGGADEAVDAAAPALAEPLRATSAPALGRLRLALATRVHLPAGRARTGRALLFEVVRTAERHHLDSLLGDAWTLLANAEEEAAHPTEALHALRSARAAEYRHLTTAESARTLLATEVGTATPDPTRATSLLHDAVVRPPSHTPPDTRTASPPASDLPGTAPDPHPNRAHRSTATAKPRPSAQPPATATPSATAAPHPAAPDFHSVVQGPHPATSDAYPVAPVSHPIAPGTASSAPVSHPIAPGPAFPAPVPHPAAPDSRSTVSESQSGAPDLLITAPGSPSTSPPAPPSAAAHPAAAANRPATDSSPPPPDESDYSATLVRVAPRGFVDPVDPPEDALPIGGEALLNALAGHVRALAPDDAEFIRSDQGEFAVLLPNTPQDKAERLAATIRATTDGDWLPGHPNHGIGITTGVATRPGTPEGPRDGIEDLLLAARDALTALTTTPTTTPRRADALRRPKPTPGNARTTAPGTPTPAENVHFGPDNLDPATGPPPGSVAAQPTTTDFGDSAVSWSSTTGPAPASTTARSSATEPEAPPALWSGVEDSTSGPTAARPGATESAVPPASWSGVGDSPSGSTTVRPGGAEPGDFAASWSGAGSPAPEPTAPTPSAPGLAAPGSASTGPAEAERSGRGEATHGSGATGGHTADPFAVQGHPPDWSVHRIPPPGTLGRRASRRASQEIRRPSPADLAAPSIGSDVAAVLSRSGLTGNPPSGGRRRAEDLPFGGEDPTALPPEIPTPNPTPSRHNAATTHHRPTTDRHETSTTPRHGADPTPPDPAGARHEAGIAQQGVAAQYGAAGADAGGARHGAGIAQPGAGAEHAGGAAQHGAAARDGAAADAVGARHEAGAADGTDAQAILRRFDTAEIRRVAGRGSRADTGGLRRRAESGGGARRAADRTGTDGGTNDTDRLRRRAQAASGETVDARSALRRFDTAELRRRVQQVSGKVDPQTRRADTAGVRRRGQDAVASPNSDPAVGGPLDVQSVLRKFDSGEVRLGGTRRAGAPEPDTHTTESVASPTTPTATESAAGTAATEFATGLTTPAATEFAGPTTPAATEFAAGTTTPAAEFAANPDLLAADGTSAGPANVRSPAGSTTPASGTTPTGPTTAYLPPTPINPASGTTPTGPIAPESPAELAVPPPDGIPAGSVATQSPAESAAPAPHTTPMGPVDVQSLLRDFPVGEVRFGGTRHASAADIDTGAAEAAIPPPAGADALTKHGDSPTPDTEAGISATAPDRSSAAQSSAAQSDEPSAARLVLNRFGVIPARRSRRRAQDEAPAAPPEATIPSPPEPDEIPSPDPRPAAPEVEPPPGHDEPIGDPRTDPGADPDATSRNTPGSDTGSTAGSDSGSDIGPTSQSNSGSGAGTGFRPSPESDTGSGFRPSLEPGAGLGFQTTSGSGVESGFRTIPGSDAAPAFRATSGSDSTPAAPTPLGSDAASTSRNVPDSNRASASPVVPGLDPLSAAHATTGTNRATTSQAAPGTEAERDPGVDAVAGSSAGSTAGAQPTLESPAALEPQADPESPAIPDNVASLADRRAIDFSARLRGFPRPAEATPADSLGPLHGPEVRPPDLPPRRGGRRERTASSGLADLLAEAMVAFQATRPEGDRNRSAWADDARAADPEHTDPTPAEPARPERDTGRGVGRSADTDAGTGRKADAGGDHGRHRSSEWAPADFDSG